MHPARAPRRKKRAKRTDGDAATAPRPPRRALRAKKGGLANMPSMPIDILVEIFGHLLPMDLLNLARTTKAFRAFIMKRESSFIWRSARHNVPGLPDCPPYLSEPAFAHLAFHTECHVCSKKNCGQILWRFRARICGNCRHDERRLTMHLPKCPLPNTEMSELVPEIADFYQTEEIEEVYNRICDASGKPEVFKYVEERKVLVHQINMHSELCKVWMRNRASSRAQELEDIRHRRFNDILDKLRTAGWEKEIECMQKDRFQMLQENAQVRLSKPLTDRAWQKMQDEIIAIVQQVREHRLQEEEDARVLRRIPVLLKFIEEHIKSTCPSAEADLMPQAVDVAFFPEFHKLMLAPEDVDITGDIFLPLLARLPSMVEEWKDGVKAELSAMVAKTVDVPGGVDLLSLAVACFHCGVCSRHDLRYPAILAHPCFRETYRLPGSQGYDQVVFHAAGMRRWSADCLRCDSAYVRAVMEACGTPVEWTTAEEMDALDLRFRATHTHVPERRTIAGWRAAYLGLFRYTVIVADDEEQKVARPIEALRRDVRRGWLIWCCALCRGPGATRRGTVKAIQSHLQDEHSVLDASVETGEIYLHPDNDQHEENVVYLYSDELTEEKLRAGDLDRFVRGQACFFPFSSTANMDN